MMTFGRRSVGAEVTADKTGRFGMRSRGRRIISREHTRMGALVPMQFVQRKVRDGLMIDSSCAACGLPVSVASEVSVQELIRPPQEFVAANAEKIRELGLRTPTLGFQNGDVQSVRLSVMDELDEPLVAASK